MNFDRTGLSHIVTTAPRLQVGAEEVRSKRIKHQAQRPVETGLGHSQQPRSTSRCPCHASKVLVKLGRESINTV
jgi:hypothetical protein